jgi:peptide/nickel transport system substrate-binding protein
MSPALLALLAALAAPRGQVVVHLRDEPTSLHPFKGNEETRRIIGSYVFDSLLDQDPDEPDRFRPRLAESWEAAPDARSLRFRLRKDRRFHDGKPVTAADVEFTFRLVRDPKTTAGFLKNYFQNVKELRAVGDHEVVVSYSEAFWRAFPVLVKDSFPILPRHLLESAEGPPADWDRKPVGSGPYRVVKWEAGEVVLERNDDYPPPLPAIPRLVFRFVKDATASFQALLSGELDFHYLLLTEQYEDQTGDEKFRKGFERDVFYQGNCNFIAWNLRRAPLDDARVRLALTHLMDREGLVRDFYRGLAKVVTGPQSFFGPAYDRSIAPWPYDPKHAEALLDEAGWSDRDDDGVRDKDGKPFSIELMMIADNAPADAQANLFLPAFKRAGLQVTPRRLDLRSMLDLVKHRKFDGASFAITMEPEDDPYQGWHSSQAPPEAGSNYSGFSGADKLIEDSRRTLDPAARRERYLLPLHRRLHEEQPFSFLYATAYKAAWSKRLKGVRFHRARRPGWDVREWSVE